MQRHPLKILLLGSDACEQVVWLPIHDVTWLSQQVLESQQQQCMVSNVWESPLWMSHPWAEASAKMVVSAWNSQRGIAIVRKDRSSLGQSNG